MEMSVKPGGGHVSWVTVELVAPPLLLKPIITMEALRLSVASEPVFQKKQKSGFLCRRKSHIL